MRFLYKTKQNITQGQCKEELERNDNIECKAGAKDCGNKGDSSYCESDSSYSSETSDVSAKDSDMRIIRKRKIYRQSPSGQKGECQLESCMEVDLSSSITGLNINSPQGQTCIVFERCPCKKGRIGGARPETKKEIKTNCLKSKPKAPKKKIRRSSRQKKKKLRCVNSDDYDETIPIHGGSSDASIPFDIPYDDQ